MAASLSYPPKFLWLLSPPSNKAQSLISSGPALFRKPGHFFWADITGISRVSAPTRLSAPSGLRTGTTRACPGGPYLPVERGPSIVVFPLPPYPPWGP
jgi:hypothetical protein